MANIKLQRGDLSKVQNTPIEDGALSIVKDAGQILIDDSTKRTIVGEANYIKGVTYPATVDGNGTLSINNVTTATDGLMSKTDKTNLDEHIANENIHLTQEEKDWLSTTYHNDGSIVLQDETTSKKYLLSVNNGALELVEAPDLSEPIVPTLTDGTLGNSYQLVLDNGELFLQEVS